VWDDLSGAASRPVYVPAPDPQPEPAPTADVI
jgi:hypothetical protein